MTEHQTTMVARPPTAPDGTKASDPFAWLRKSGDESDQSDGDLSHGQILIVAARWVLVGAGLGLAMWNPIGIGPLRLQVLVLLLIAVGNFFLHAQLLRRRLALEPIAYAASAADLAVITILIASQDGFKSDLFVFYFPSILALSVAFRPAITTVYAGATLGLYALLCFGTIGADAQATEVQAVVVRLVMISAVAVCGGLYQKLERDRRSGDAQPDNVLSDQRRSVPAPG